jgi:hypothetical protein
MENKIFKIIPVRSQFISADDLFIWLSDYTGIVSSSVNYKTYESAEHGIVLETSLYTERKLDDLIYPHEAIEIVTETKL